MAGEKNGRTDTSRAIEVTRFLMQVMSLLVIPALLFIWKLESRVSAIELTRFRSETGLELERRVDALEFDNPPGNAARQIKLELELERLRDEVEGLKR